MGQDTNTPLYMYLPDPLVITGSSSVGDFGVARTAQFIQYIRFDTVMSIDHMFENEISQFPIESGAEFSDHVLVKQDKLSFTAVIVNSPFLESPAVNNSTDFFAENFGQIRAGGPLGQGAVDLSNYYNPNIPAEFYPLKLNYPKSTVADDFSSLDNARKSVARRTVNLNAQGAIDTVLGAVGLGPDLEPQPSAFGDPGYGAKRGITPGTTGSVVPVESNRAQIIFDYLKNIRDKALSFDVITKEKTYKSMLITSLGVPISNETGNSLEFNIQCQEVRRVVLSARDVGVTVDTLSASKKSVGSKQSGSNSGESSQNNQTSSQTGEDSAEVQAAKARNAAAAQEESEARSQL